MKRRGFLQALGGAVAALFAPKVAAATNADYLTDPAKWRVPRSIFVSSRTARFGYGHGTFNHPFATIREAVNVAETGDVIVLKSCNTEAMLSDATLETKSGIPIVGIDDARVRMRLS